MLPQSPAVPSRSGSFTAAPRPSQVIEEIVSEPVREADISDTTEIVIRIIMEATGYERDEIEPEMDLREDLSIRSSRLPVIMDAVESHSRSRSNSKILWMCEQLKIFLTALPR